MSFNYSFRFAEDRKDLDSLFKFNRQYPMGYPGFMDWSLRVIDEILSGWKKAILGFSEDYLVSSLIFQPHKVFPENFLEIKSARADESIWSRYFIVFSLRQVEIESREKYDFIICDYRSDRKDVANLLNFMGYKELLKIPLYEKNVEDIVAVKSLKENTGLIDLMKKDILRKAF